MFDPSHTEKGIAFSTTATSFSSSSPSSIITGHYHNSEDDANDDEDGDNNNVNNKNKNENDTKFSLALIVYDNRRDLMSLLMALLCISMVVIYLEQSISQKNVTSSVIYIIDNKVLLFVLILFCVF